MSPIGGEPPFGHQGSKDDAGDAGAVTAGTNIAITGGIVSVTDDVALAGRLDVDGDVALGSNWNPTNGNVVDLVCGLAHNYGSLRQDKYIDLHGDLRLVSVGRAGVSIVGLQVVCQNPNPGGGLTPDPVWGSWVVPAIATDTAHPPIGVTPPTSDYSYAAGPPGPGDGTQGYSTPPSSPGQTTASAVQVAQSGYLLNALAGATPGTAYYLSETVAGAITTTRPSRPGSLVILVGIAADATTLQVLMMSQGRVADPAPVAVTQLLWSVDPVNGSDSNDGATDGTALKTLTECARRLWGQRIQAGSQVMIRLLGNQLATDFPIFFVPPNGNPIGTGPFFGAVNIVGVPTVLYTGTISTPQNAAAGDTQDAHFTDAGATIANILTTTTTKVLLEKTNGTKSMFYGVKDLTGGQIQISQPITDPLAVQNLADGDSYRALVLPTVHDIRCLPGTAWNLCIYRCADTTTTAQYPSDGISWCQSIFTTTAVRTGNFYNCAWTGAGANWGSSASPAAGAIFGGFLRGTGNTAYSLQSNATFGGSSGTLLVTLLNAVIQVFANAKLNTINLMAFDTTTTNGVVQTFRGAFANVKAIGGARNTGKLLGCRESGSTIVYDSIAGGATTDASPINNHGTAVAIGALPSVDENHQTAIVAV